jgi:hypothetical protein
MKIQPDKKTNDAVPCRATDDGMFYRSHTGKGNSFVQLSNFTARIVRDIEEDDGVEKRHTFEVEARLGGTTHRFSLTAAQFAAMNWPPVYIGARAITFPGSTKAQLRAAIQLLSKNVPTEKVFKHLGWGVHSAEPVYLHAGGGIGSKGAVPSLHVELPEQLNRYHLPAPPSGTVLRKAVQASLRLLEVAPDVITVPLYGAVWRVALGQTDFGLHLTGPSGEGKTALSAVIQQHWGKELDAGHLPATWLSTANANEFLAFLAKDALLVVDDFVPMAGVSDRGRQHKEADRLLRGQGNGAGRGRLAADATLRLPRPPRGLILSTGEDTPRGQSLRARLLVLELSPGAVRWQQITRCQEDATAGFYAAAFAGFVRWVAPQLEKIRQGMPRRLTDLRDQATASGQHRRTPGIVANLAFGLELFGRFAVTVGTMTKAESKKFQQRCWQALGEVAAAQAALQAHGEPAQRFLGLLTASMTAGKAHIAGPDGQPPAQPVAWGWRDDGDVWKPEGNRIGWVVNADLYLEPEAALASAQGMACEGHEPLGVESKTLHKRLHEQGQLVSTDTARGRLTVRRTLQGRVRSVLHLLAGALLGPSSPTRLPPVNGAVKGQTRKA